MDKYVDSKKMDCKLCMFSAYQKTDWTRHIHSKKHINIFTIVEDELIRVHTK